MPERSVDGCWIGWWWIVKNSESFIPREHIYGSLRGVDFGPAVSVIARSPLSMLLWLGGHSWSVNGFQRYASSNLTLIKNRVQMDGWRNYKAIGPEGGRLTVARIALVKKEITELFGEEHWPSIEEAILTKSTLIIEGGGEMPQPSPKLGRQAYENWRDNRTSVVG